MQVALLGACTGSSFIIKVPGSALGLSAGSHAAEAVPVTVRGRTAAELLVSLPAGLAQPGAKKLVALHYKKLLQYADADALLILAHKVSVSDLASAECMADAPAAYVPW